jgi:hypothetical protein
VFSQARAPVQTGAIHNVHIDLHISVRSWLNLGLFLVTDCPVMSLLLYEPGARTHTMQANGNNKGEDFSCGVYVGDENVPSDILVSLQCPLSSAC